MATCLFFHLLWVFPPFFFPRRAPPHSETKSEVHSQTVHTVWISGGIMIKMFNNAGGERRSNLSSAGRGDCHRLKKSSYSICYEWGLKKKKNIKQKKKYKRLSAAESYIITHHNTSTPYILGVLLLLLFSSLSDSMDTFPGTAKARPAYVLTKREEAQTRRPLMKLPAKPRQDRNWFRKTTGASRDFCFRVCLFRVKSRWLPNGPSLPRRFHKHGTLPARFPASSPHCLSRASIIQFARPTVSSPSLRWRCAALTMLNCCRLEMPLCAAVMLKNPIPLVSNPPSLGTYTALILHTCSLAEVLRISLRGASSAQLGRRPILSAVIKRIKRANRDFFPVWVACFCFILEQAPCRTLEATQPQKGSAHKKRRMTLKIETICSSESKPTTSFWMN